LFQQAVERVNHLSAADITVGSTLVITNEEHRFLSLEQLREIKGVNATLLLEPTGRNTAPALTLAALQAIEGGQDPILVVTPADQTVTNTERFTQALHQAIGAAAQGSIVVLGIKPHTAETGYGYIQAAPALAGQVSQVVQRFVEKPDAATAQSYLDHGGYCWNAGIFAGRVDAFVQAFARHLPRTACLLQADVVTETAWFSTEATSIDHGVMEPAAGDGALVMVPVACGWSDLGAWSALGDVLGEGEGGAVLAREVVAIDARGNSVVAPERLVALLGVEDLVVVDTPDVLLVTTRDRAQDVRTLVDEVERRGGARYT
jgi:mannose-1-phosphate guanylyltransferase/mannose-6-phosphate isomerase